jgi:circadian clock protein KaiC
VPTGIEGFDDITGGGPPRGRPTLIVGGPGSGKTLFAMEFLVNGATKFNEPGAFFSFEEAEKELALNVASLGFDLKALEKKKMLTIDYIKIEAAEVVETGEYDLEGLFVRLGYAIDAIGAKRVVLDTIESIFTTFSNTLILRSELRRLFLQPAERGYWMSNHGGAARLFNHVSKSLSLVLAIPILLSSVWATSLFGTGSTLAVEIHSPS